MSENLSARACVSVVAAVLAVSAVGFTVTTQAGAQSVKKDRNLERHTDQGVKPRSGSRSDRSRSDSDRDPAIFSNEVDLSRPGGPKRFFELLEEESR